jgi:hypothetical protein
VTALEEMLVKGSSRRLCFACGSANLRPLVVLKNEGFPPGDARHNIGYLHDAIFDCDDCHHGYAEICRHDCFDSEEVWDQEMGGIERSRRSGGRANFPQGEPDQTVRYAASNPAFIKSKPYATTSSREKSNG